MRGRSLESVLIPFFPIVLGPIILFSPILFSGKALYWGIPSLQFIPWRVLAWGIIRGGEIPLWNPMNGMGAPLLANYQLALFYPPSWLLYVFAAAGGTPWMAWAHTVLTVLHLIWAGLGMVHLMKRLNYGKLGQLITGLSFSLCGYMVARAGFFSMVWTAAWIPWVIASASKIASPIGDSAGEKSFIHLSLIVHIMMMLLAGHAQLSWYTMIFAAAWVVVGGCLKSGLNGAGRAFIQLAGASVVSACLAAVQLLPTAEYLLASQRSAAVDFEAALGYSFWPWRFITFLAPDFFGNPGLGDYWGYANFWEDAVYFGLLPFLLAVISIRLAWLRKEGRGFSNSRSLVIFLWVAILVSVVLALGKNTPIFPFLYFNIPTFDMFNAPARYMIWAEMCLIMLAGISAEELWQQPKGKSLYWLRLATAGGAAVTIGALLAWNYMGAVSPTFIRSTAIAGVWGLGTGLLTLFKPIQQNKLKKGVWLSCLTLLLVVDLLTAMWNINPAIDKDFFQMKSDTQEMFSEAIDGRRIYISKSEEYRLKYDRFLRFEDFHPIEDSENIRRLMIPNLNILEGISSVNNFDPFVPGRYSTWMAYLDELPRSELVNWLELMNVSEQVQMSISEPLGVEFVELKSQERIRFSTCAIYAQSEEDSFDLIKNRLESSTNKPIECVIIENEGDFQGLSNEAINGADFEYRIVDNNPNNLRIDMQSEADGYLILADTWYPGWHARVDGEVVEIFRADYLFCAVYLPSGAHQVEFFYRPISFIVGLIITLVSLIGLLIKVSQKMKLFGKFKVSEKVV